MICLGFDTSNYTTSVAAYDGAAGENVSRLLPVKAGELGLRQSEALFSHVKRLPELSDRLFAHLDPAQLAAVGVSTRPRAVEGSYMPCFLAGESQARVLASALHLPLYEFSHQQGHIAAVLCSAGRLDLLGSDFLAWHLSGGTTELLYVRSTAEGEIACERIGGTTDISAGQLIDRTGQLLGLDFPAGKALDALAAQESGVSGQGSVVSGQWTVVRHASRDGSQPSAVPRTDEATGNGQQATDAPHDLPCLQDTTVRGTVVDFNAVAAAELRQLASQRRGTGLKAVGGVRFDDRSVNGDGGRGLPRPDGLAMTGRDVFAAEARSVRPPTGDYFRVKVNGCEFSLSGVQNQVQNNRANGASDAETAYFALRSVIEAVKKATKNAQTKFPLPVVFSGGVASNAMLRRMMPDAVFGEPRYSTDNALGVAVLTWLKHYPKPESLKK